MSKELEAHKKLVVNLMTGKYNEENRELLSIVEKSLTPPTADEVCKALSEFCKTSVYYESGNFLYREERFYNQPFLVATTYKSGLIEMTKNVLPPHLITLIGRFYEGLEVKE